MKGKSLLVIAAAAGAAFILLKGDAFGASGGVGPGDTKKATVISGITAPDVTKPISEEITNPAPYPSSPTSPTPPNFIPNPFTNPNPNILPFQPSPYILEQMAAVENVKSTGISDFKITGEGKYSGYRNGYYVEGDLTTKKLQINAKTGQAYTTDTGGYGSEILYTEKSRTVFEGHTKGIGYNDSISTKKESSVFQGRVSEGNIAPTYSSGGASTSRETRSQRYRRTGSYN